MAGSDNKSRLVHNTRESPPKELQNICNSSKFQELMKATSKHTELLEANDVFAQDQYFEKLEKKEQLELKMMETYKVPCKAVQCKKVRLLTVAHHFTMHLLQSALDYPG
jgi:minichromosome maintenance protein 10